MDESISTTNNISQPPMTRRERKRLARQEKKANKELNRTKNMKGLISKILVLIIILLAGYLFYKYITKPLPGEEVKDLGREHVTDIAGVEYSSNPPTSGPHFTVWAKPGVYDRLISDGHLIHSLEHGYVVIYYDCTKEIRLSSVPNMSLVSNVMAHDEPAKESTDSGQLLKHLKYQPKEGESWFTPENPPEIEVELPEVFETESCKNFVDMLSQSTKISERVIVMPRINMDTLIALTAWGRIEKLQSLDEKRIKNFIKSFHNKGPEKTME